MLARGPRKFATSTNFGDDAADSAPHEWLDNELKKLGQGSAVRLAEAANMSEGQISKRRSGAVRIKADELQTFRRFFATHSPQGPATHEAPQRDGRIMVIGYVGAGDQQFEYFFDPGEYEEIEPPGIMEEGAVALAIRGDSLGPAFNGGYVIYNKLPQANAEALLGELCVVRTSGGATYIKTIAGGREPGSYDLLSVHGKTIESVKIEWATPVLAVMPRRGKFPPRIT